MGPVKITYYGMDGKLTEILNKEKVKVVDQHERLTIEQAIPDENHIVLCDLILENKMDLLLVDLSNTDNIDKALKALLYELHLKNIKIIGVWNEMENPKLKKWRFELGINTHFFYWARDLGSMEDLMLGLARYLKIPNENFTFYTKKQDQTINVSTPIRINHFTSNGIQIESDIAINKNEILNCYFPSIPHYPFTDFYVDTVSRLNLSYPLEYQGTLEHVFYDNYGQLYRSSFDNLEDIDYLEKLAENPIISKNLDETQVQAIITSFNQNKRESKNKKDVLRRMVGKLSKFSDIDTLKNLVIDPSFPTYKLSQNPIWYYPYKFLLVSTLEDNLNILNTCGAQLVTFVISESINPDNFTETIEFVQLKTISSRLKNNYKSLGIEPPLLQIYNLDIETPDLINILEYDHLNVTKYGFDIKKHIVFIKKFIKTPAYTKGVKFYGHDLDKISPKSYSEMSHGFLLRQVQLISISESEIVFESPIDFPLNYSFIVTIKDESKLYITIYKIDESEEIKKYYGIVNSINEKEKQKLRKLIMKG